MADDPVDWARDLPGWPNAAQSRRVRQRPHNWHVQEAGQGRDVLLIHGAGASTHTWRDILPAVAENAHMCAIDLPGQGFTRAGTLRRASLTQMTEDIDALISACGWQPRLIVGHSAGAALALNLALTAQDGDRLVPAVLGINAALDRFEGVAGWLFPMLAKLLALNPLTSWVFTLGGDPRTRAARLIAKTGSKIDERGLACYARLISDRDHVEATLQMMAQWDVDRLWIDMARLAAPVTFVTGAKDAAVPPDVSRRAAAQIPSARYQPLEGLGHLAHEEAPGQFRDLILDVLNATERAS